MKARLSIIFICMLLLYGCSKMPDHYPFPNSLETVQSVELIRNRNTDGVGIDENNFEILCVLDKMAARDFLSMIQDLPTQRRRTGPYWGYGPYLAKVVYMNGDIEIFGCHHIEFIECGSAATGFGSYEFDHDDFMEVFSMYYPVNHYNGK